MKKPDVSLLLKQKIFEKEFFLRNEGMELKDHFQQTYEGLKPINLLKNTVKKMFVAPEADSNLLNSALGFTTGIVAKKIFTRNSDNVFTKLSGMIIEMIVVRKVTANADEIKIIGGILLKKLLSKKDTSEKHNGA